VTLVISSKLCQVLSAAMLLAGLSVPVWHAAAAAGPATSNKGGQVRGTARADERAGDHGDQGRDRAEANKTKAKTGTASTGKPSK
jgi:hypothetical protein